jgi:hypothetical protein
MGMSWANLLVIALYVLTLIPVAKLLRRLGFSPGWSLLVLVPLVNLIALWALAFMRWPIDRASNCAPALP